MAVCGDDFEPLKSQYRAVSKSKYVAKVALVFKSICFRAINYVIRHCLTKPRQGQRQEEKRQEKKHSDELENVNVVTAIKISVGSRFELI